MGWLARPYELPLARYNRRRSGGWHSKEGVREMARRTSVLAVAMLLLAMTLAACGAEATATPRAASSAAASAAPSAAAASSSAPSSAVAATGSSAAATPAGGTKEVKVGVVLTLTGASAIYGTPQRNGVQLAVDEINAAGGIPGVKLVPIFEDDGGTKDKGITAFEKVIETDNVLAIIGPTLSNTAVSADPIAQQAGVPVLAVSNTGNGIVEIGDYIFRDSLAEFQVIPNTVKAAKEKLGLTKVAIIYNIDNAFTKAGYDEFKKALDANGIQITTTQSYGANDTDYSAQLTAIKQTNPDAIIVSALAEGAPIAKQARELGIEQRVTIIGGNGLNSPDYIKNSGPAGEGTIVGAAWNAANNTQENQKFIAAYKAKYNSDPDQFAAQAYSGVYILAEAIKKAGPNADRKAVRDALAGVKGLSTPLGTFSFTPERNADHPPVVQVVRNGKFEVLK
jgi:branched-chain amino acid transport system substrate-binding protein